MCAHVAVNAHFESASESISYFFFLAFSLSASVAAGWRAAKSTAGERRKWIFMSIAFAIWLTATVTAAWAYFLEHASPNVASLDDFFYFFYGVPILLAIATPDDGQPLSSFFWFDGLQSVAVAFLAYIAIFSAVPFSRGPLHPMPISRLIWVYDGENLILAMFATARLVVTYRAVAFRRFFQILTAFLWLYGISAAIYNHIVAAFIDAGRLDVLVDIPLAVFVYLALFVTTPEADRKTTPVRTRMALFLDSVRPIVLGLALVILSLVVAREHFKTAIVAILGAFAIYGMRSAMLQSRLLSTQLLLETANSRLAEMTLEDGLTGIANRRCFDRRLEQEWNRAHRKRSPLSLLLIDIDHFKKLNDTHGHLVGDECLIQVAHTMRGVLNRPGDLLARYGGEEFVALLPETDEAGARSVAARLQAALHATQPVASIETQVTVSVGATTWRDGAQFPVEQFVETADRALYNAKQNGRNRVEFLALEAHP